MIRRITTAIILLALLPMLLLSLAGAGGAEAQELEVSVSASMNAYYYSPGEQAYLDVDMEIPNEMRDETVRLDLLIYTSASTRSYLASFREAASRSPSIRRSLELIYPGEEWTDTLYELDLTRLGLSAGVYPIETRVTQGGETLASDFNYLVIINPEIGYPLNLALLWMLDFLPATDAQGNDLDAGLAAACSSVPSETGFLYALTETLTRFPEVHSSMVAPYTTYQDLEMLAEITGGEGSNTGEEREGEIDYVKDGAVKVKQGLDEMFDSGQVDLVPTSYALADLDLLISLGWEIEKGKSDADIQIELGVMRAEDMGAEGSGLIGPLFKLSDSLLQKMVDHNLEPALVDEETVQYSEAGSALLQGTTLSEPIDFINQNYLLRKAFMRDEVLYDYLENTTQRDASHMVQAIFAELAVLQRERPYDIRSSVLAFPSNFVPSQEFLQELYGSLEGCPWLQTRYLSELNNDQFAIEGLALPAPVYPGSTSSYIQKLGPIRGNLLDFIDAVPEEHPIRETLLDSLLTAQNYRFLDEKDVAASQKYLDSINAIIEGETSQVNIEEKSTVTLSGTKGQLTVDITSTLDYPIAATLRLSNRSVSFPDGNSQQVIIEPRENSFDFSIDTRRKGSFIIDILLENGNLVIDQTSTNVNTSIINTLAIILLACLAGLMALIIILRRLSARLHTGKHAKGRKE